MYFTSLTAEEYYQFTQQHFCHYTQDIKHFTYRHQHRKDAHIVGVKLTKDHSIIAACLLTEARCLKFFKYFYSQRGPVMDHNQIHIVKFFYQELAKYLKKHKGIFVLADPYILNNIRDTNGEIIRHFDNGNLLTTLHHLGYHHQGYSIGYSQFSQIRWLSVLDLKDKTEEQLLKDMDYQTRRNINKTFEMGVKIKDISITNIGSFYKLFNMAIEKHGFSFRELNYFKETLKMYGEHAMIKKAYIDLNDYLIILQDKQQQLSKQLAEVTQMLSSNPNSKKNKTKYNQIQQQFDSNKKKIERTLSLIETDGNLIDLAAAFYIYNTHEMYYLSSGSNPKYNDFMGPYRLQWEMIQYTKSLGINRYNFYGITGDFSKYADDYGVQQFKKGFNAHVEEYIGDFIKPLSPILFKVFKLLNQKLLK